VAGPDGVGRAGWYTYRWVDRLLFPANGPSVTRIVPELEHLQVGDHILDGPPDTDCWFNVEMLEPGRLMVLRSTTHTPRHGASGTAPGWSGCGAGTSSNPLQRERA
jgi:hypothetical protein